MDERVRMQWNEYDAPHRDLRELLERVERAGELTKPAVLIGISKSAP